MTTGQHAIDLKASRKAYTDMLGLFINQKIDEQTVLVIPAPPALTDSINRPELKAYDLQAKSYSEQQHLTKISNYPQLSAFFQGGVGVIRPRLIFLASGISPYYITGFQA